MPRRARAAAHGGGARRARRRRARGPRRVARGRGARRDRRDGARARSACAGTWASGPSTVPLLAARAEGDRRGDRVVADQLERALELDPPGVKDSASPKLKALRSELATARRRASDRLRSLASDPDLQPASAGGFRHRARRPARASPCARARAARCRASSTTPATRARRCSSSRSRSSSCPTGCASSRATSATRSRASSPSSRATSARTPATLRPPSTRSPRSTSRSRAARSRAAWRGCPIEPADDVELVAARHPLLDPATVVPIDLPLAGVRVLVLSGANTGGKTVALKTLGLCALLHQCGLHVPAAARPAARLRATCSPTSATSSRSRASLSTFSGHLRNLVHDRSTRRRRARSCCSTRWRPAPTRSRAPRSPARCSTSSRSAPR